MTRPEVGGSPASMKARTVWPGALGVGASGLGLFFSAFSTHDYALHLDRQLHGTHCSFVPGLVDASGGDNGCTAAMYSAFSAVLRAKYWGGVPISLFAVGAYAAFIGLALYVLIGRHTASVRFMRGYAMATVFPLIASIVMFVIALTQLGAFCKLCVGLYFSSGVLFASGVLAFMQSSVGATKPAPAPAPRPVDPETTVRDPDPWGAVAEANPPAPPVTMEARAKGPGFAPKGSAITPLAVLATVGVAAALPALVWVASLPKYDAALLACGTLQVVTDKAHSLVKISTTSPVQPAITFEDPLCPTCRAFHQRLEAEGLLDQLDYTLSLFPLDNECNWMLDRPLHPGACIVSRALICADEQGKGRMFLDWAYQEQEDLAAAGKSGPAPLKAKIEARFPGLAACSDDKKTKQRLDKQLQFAVDNKIKVSTPQMFLGDRRLCDEDTDLGLRFAFAKLAPKVK